MHRVMFICHGNICRSPMAEFILRKMVIDKGIGENFYIASSATSTEEIGNPVYPPARAELKKHGIDTLGKVAVRFTPNDYDKYDLVILMDNNNLRNIFRIIDSDPEGKIHKLMDYTSRGGEVADPWYCGNFDKTYSDIYDGCVGLLKHLGYK